ncbi:HEPN domain-containing protein [Caulobacter sp. AP07]|uniref:HEPN domain-containing protein n=1 Tax=Caulobacter sp. AP07 TaxID=1144304 RepID=UPI0012FA5EFE|nr:HEPN domain-containing protein [Caulobacter sp. AP07]
MTYIDKFKIVDDYLVHLDEVMGGIGDPFIQSRYLGFVLISAVTGYELAIKDIFYDFSDKKHKVLGSVARGRFERLNGQIKYRNLANDHIKLFGQKYSDKFKKLVEMREKAMLRSARISMLNSYDNVISWRHQFVHAGRAPNTTNYDEIKAAYAAGKEIIHCVDATMRR